MCHMHAIIFLRIIIVFLRIPELCPAIQPDDHRSSRLQRRGQRVRPYQENGGAKCATCGRFGGAQYKFDNGMGRRRFRLLLVLCTSSIRIYARTRAHTVIYTYTYVYMHACYLIYVFNIIFLKNDIIHTIMHKAVMIE